MTVFYLLDCAGQPVRPFENREEVERYSSRDY